MVGTKRKSQRRVPGVRARPAKKPRKEPTATDSDGQSAPPQALVSGSISDLSVYTMGTIFIGRCLSMASAIDPCHLESYIYGFWSMVFMQYRPIDGSAVSILQPQFPVWSSRQDDVRRLAETELLSKATTRARNAKSYFLDFAVVIIETAPRLKHWLKVVGAPHVSAVAGRTLEWFFRDFVPQQTAFKLLPEFLTVVGLKAPITVELKSGPSRSAEDLATHHDSLTTPMHAAQRQAEDQTLALFGSWRFFEQDSVISVAGCGDYFTVRRSQRQVITKKILRRLKGKELDTLFRVGGDDDPSKPERASASSPIPDIDEDNSMSSDYQRAFHAPVRRRADVSAAPSLDTPADQAAPLSYETPGLGAASDEDSDSDFDETDSEEVAGLSPEEKKDRCVRKLAEHNLCDTKRLQRDRQRIQEYSEQLEQFEIESATVADQAADASAPPDVVVLRQGLIAKLAARDAAQAAHDAFEQQLEDARADPALDDTDSDPDQPRTTKTRQYRADAENRRATRAVARQRQNELLAGADARREELLDALKQRREELKAAATEFGASVLPSLGGAFPMFSDRDLDLYHRSRTPPNPGRPCVENRDPALFFAGDETTKWSGILRIGTEMGEKYLKYLEQVVRRYEDAEWARRRSLTFPEVPDHE